MRSKPISHKMASDIRHSIDSAKLFKGTVQVILIDLPFIELACRPMISQ